ncbi:hypothetical protein [Sedimentitalea sp.]|uniref:hypothetical protein n=1 Tax=Sedimentitalea sp. TaxID=2048915 RepID=UPI00329908C2
MKSYVVHMIYTTYFLTAFAYAAPIDAFRKLTMSREFVIASGSLPAGLSIVWQRFGDEIGAGVNVRIRLKSDRRNKSARSVTRVSSSAPAVSASCEEEI